MRCLGRELPETWFFVQVSHDDGTQFFYGPYGTEATAKAARKNAAYQSRLDGTVTVLAMTAGNVSPTCPPVATSELKGMR